MSEDNNHNEDSYDCHKDDDDYDDIDDDRPTLIQINKKIEKE